MKAYVQCQQSSCAHHSRDTKYKPNFTWRRWTSEFRYARDVEAHWSRQEDKYSPLHLTVVYQERKNDNTGMKLVNWRLLPDTQTHIITLRAACIKAAEPSVVTSSHDTRRHAINWGPWTLPCPRIWTQLYRKLIKRITITGLWYFCWFVLYFLLFIIHIACNYSTYLTYSGLHVAI